MEAADDTEQRQEPGRAAGHTRARRNHNYPRIVPPLSGVVGNAKLLFGRKAGDDAARAQRFRQAALPHLDAVYALACHWLQQPIDAEDAVQECYLCAFRHFDGLRNQDIKPWLFAILHNVCRVEVARRSRAVSYDVNSARENPDDTIPMWQEVQETPEAQMLQKLDVNTIRDLVAALPDPFREVVVLRELEDLSYREIADVIDVPIGTVMSRLARGRAMLRALWIATENKPPKSCEASTPDDGRGRIGPSCQSEG